MEKIKRSGHISWSFYRGKNDDCIIINILYTVPHANKKKTLNFHFIKYIFYIPFYKTFLQHNNNTLPFSRCRKSTIFSDPYN